MGNEAESLKLVLFAEGIDGASLADVRFFAHSAWNMCIQSKSRSVSHGKLVEAVLRLLERLPSAQLSKEERECRQWCVLFMALRSIDDIDAENADEAKETAQ